MPISAPGQRAILLTLVFGVWLLLALTSAWRKSAAIDGVIDGTATIVGPTASLGKAATSRRKPTRNWNRILPAIGAGVFILLVYMLVKVPLNAMSGDAPGVKMEQ